MDRETRVEQFLHTEIPLLKQVGLRVAQLNETIAETELPWQDENRNHINTVYAGVQFTVLEATGGILFAAAFDVKEYFIVVKEMKIRYLNPARGDLRCRFTFSDSARASLLAELNSTGKAEFILHGTLHNAKEEIVAEAEGLYYVAPRRK